MNKENTYKKILSLSISYQNWIVENNKKIFLESNPLLEKFTEIRENELSKLPYRLNLLDDLSTNENAHSKLLIRLLQYQPALKDFLTFVNKNSNTTFYFNIDKINKPVLTFERMRIDGLIRESNKYAIIIENKIHGAREQDRQIERYINKCKEIGFKVDQIYILYLTRNQEDDPSEQTWGDYKQEDFHLRYSKLSYKSEILPWLEGYLIKLSCKEQLIKSAIIQYIDHLKHMFNNKEIFSNMDAELRKFLSKELKLSEDNVENIDVINEKIKDVNELKDQLTALVAATKEDLFKEWKNNIDKKFNFEENKIFYKSDPKFLRTGVILEYKGNRFSVLIEHNFNTVYYGFGNYEATDNLVPEIKEFLEPLIKTEALREDDPSWYGWKHTTSEPSSSSADFVDAYSSFENLLELVLERMKTIK